MRPESGDPPGAAPRRLRRAEAVLARRLDGLAVLVEDVRDPHNIDAVFRSAEAFGVQRVYRVESDAKATIHPRVTQGAHRWLTIRRFTDPADAVAALRDDGYAIWAADVAPGARPLDELPLPPRVAVAVGSELEGLSPALRDGVDARFYLPMVGFTGSLNVSVTSAIVIWEIARRLRQRAGRDGDLAADVRETLRREWYGKLARTDRQRAEFPRWLEHPPPPLDERAPPPERRSLGPSRPGSGGDDDDR